MKSVWNGSLSFGLVSIEVKLYAAVKAHALGFKLLCGTCKHPLSYERWCNHCNKEVLWQDTVKGLEISKNKFFIITPEKLEQLKLEKTDTIDILEFVDRALIDPIYYEKHYYLIPSKKSEKAFFLFKKALEVSNKVAIGTFVMRDREHICSINFYQEILLLSTLNYAYEIVKITKDIEVTKVPKITDAELKLAQQLINQRTVKKFDITPFKDTFAQRLIDMVKKGKPLKVAASKKKSLKVSADKNLLAVLKQSLVIPIKKSSAKSGARA